VVPLRPAKRNRLQLKHATRGDSANATCRHSCVGRNASRTHRAVGKSLQSTSLDIFPCKQSRPTTQVGPFTSCRDHIKTSSPESYRGVAGHRVDCEHSNAKSIVQMNGLWRSHLPRQRFVRMSSVSFGLSLRYCHPSDCRQICVAPQLSFARCWFVRSLHVLRLKLYSSLCYSSFSSILDCVSRFCNASRLYRSRSSRGSSTSKDVMMIRL
jgi:hypothetical protein